MAKQGNYVTVPGGGGNWASGTSDALANLSKTLLAQSEADKERDRLAEATEQERLRYEESRADRLERNRIEDDRKRRIDDRNKVLHDITVGKHKTAQDKKSWVRDLDVSTGMDAVRRKKAKNTYGLTDELLNSDKGKEVLNIIDVDQEDLDRYYGSQYSSRFGDKFDPSLVRYKYGDVSSLQSLQEAENERAELLNERMSKIRDDQISSSKGLLGEGSGNSSSSSGSRSGKGTKSYSHILIKDMVSDFAKENTLPFTDTGMEKANKVGKHIIGTLQNMGVRPDDAKVVLKKSLDTLSTGDSLDNINDGDEDVTAAIHGALKDLREGTGTHRSSGGGGSTTDYDTTGREVLTKFATGDGLGYYQPKNIKEHRITQTRKRIDEILGRVPPKNDVTGQEKTLDPTGTKDTNVSPKGSNTYGENAFLRNIGLGTVPADQNSEVPENAPDNYVERREVLNDNNTPIDVKDLGFSNDEEASKAYRYSLSNELVKKVNDQYGEDGLIGKDGKPLDTVLVLDFDENGKKRPWKDVVSDINNRPGIQLWDRVSPEEAREAEGNPVLQKELLDSANSLIGNNLQFATSTSRMLTEGIDWLDRNYNPVPHLKRYYNNTFGEYDPEQDKLDREAYEAEQSDYALRRELLGDVDEFVDNRLGNLNDYSDIGQATSSLGSFVKNSPSAQGVIATSLAPGVGAIATRAMVKDLTTRAARVASKAASRSTPRAAPNEQLGPSINSYWKNMDRPPLDRKGADYINYQKWLRSKANPR